MATKRTVEFEFKSNAHTLVDQLQKADKGVSGIQDKLSGLSKNMTNVGKNLTKNVTAPLAGLATVSVVTVAKFDDSMSQVAAISGAAGNDLERLRDLAKDLGATTRYSASEAADAMTYLALAGYDTNQILSATPGMLNLAAAAGMDLATAADIVTDTMSGFQMNAEKAGEAADIFAAASSKSNTNVNQLGEAMKYASSTANAAGMDLAQTAAVLGVFADSGIKGGMAGTTFNAMLRDLKKANAEGKLAIEGTNIALYNQDGSMRDLGAVMADVEKATEGMTTAQRDAAMSAIFGEQAIRGANILLATGSKRYNELEQAMYDSTGASQKMAETMEDNVAGAFRAFKSQVEGIMIQIGEQLAPILRDTIIPLLSGFGEKISNLIKWFAGLDEGTKRTIITILGIVAAVGPVISVVGFVIGKIAVLIGVFKKLKIAFIAIKALLMANPFILIIAGIIAVIALIWKFRDQIWKVIKGIFDVIKNTLANIWEAIRSFFAPIITFISEMVTKIIDLFMLPYKILWNVFLLIVALVAMFLEMIWNIISPFVMKAIEIFQTIWNSIMLGLEFIKNLFLTAFTWIYETVISPLIGFFTGVFNAIWGVIRTVIDKIKQGFMGARDFIVNIFNKIKETIGKIFSTLAGIIKAPINGIIGAVNNVIIGNLNKLKVPDWVPGLGGKGVNLPRIPKLAEGGVVDSATTAIIGEGADPEAIVPLNERGISKFLGGVNIQPDLKQSTTGATVVNVTVPQAKMVVMDTNYNKIGSIIMPKIVQKLKAGGAR